MRKKNHPIARRINMMGSHFMILNEGLGDHVAGSLPGRLSSFLLQLQAIYYCTDKKIPAATSKIANITSIIFNNFGKGSSLGFDFLDFLV